MNCDNCGKLIKKRKVVHVNVAIEPKEHYFCCRKCFFEFIEKVKKNDGVIDEY